MTYYEVIDKTIWQIEADSESNAFLEVMEKQPGPPPTETRVDVEEITQAEFEGLKTVDVYPNIRAKMTCFLRADMAEMLEFYGRVNLEFKPGKVTLEVWSADSSSYTESWEAPTMSQLEKAVDLYPDGM